MVRRGSVALLALHSGNQLLQSQLFMIHCIRCMAPEALHFFVWRHKESSSLHQIGWFRILGSHRDVEVIERLVIADTALIQLPVVFVDIRLAGEPKPEGPTDWSGYGLPAVGDRVDALFPLAFYSIEIRFNSKRQYTMRLKNV